MREIKIVEKNIDERYFDFFRELYGNEKNIDFFVSDLQISLEFCLSLRTMVTVTLSNNSDLIGHASIISLPNQNTAFLGFFDLKNKEDFGLLWDEIKKQATLRGLVALTGPINGSIWFPYRCIRDSDESAFFKGELPSQMSYWQIFNDLTGDQVSYYSSMRTDFTDIIKLTEESYQKIIASEFEMTTLSGPEIDQNILAELYDFSNKVFSSQSPAYQQLPFDFFVKLYNSDKLSQLSELYLVRNEGEIIGFCSLFSEDPQTLIFKTIAVHPDYRRQEIGNALTYLVHKEAAEKGISKIIYALIRGDNTIKFFPKDNVKDLRSYSIFTLTI